MTEFMTESETRTQTCLGDVFDNYQNMMQIARTIREASLQRSITSPRVLELSRHPANLGEYLPEARITPMATHDAKLDPILSTPVRVPFDDRSFDVCYVTDAYEHVPQEMRRSLMAEMMRVTDGLVLLGSPVRSEMVTRLDRMVFDFRAVCARLM
jgi:hypothetical protein